MPGCPPTTWGALLVQQVPARLADGGTAVGARQLAARARCRTGGSGWPAWVAPTGCDAWVAQREVQEPAEYVGLWLRDAGGTAWSRARRALRRLARRAARHERAEGIGFGWVVLHKGGTYGSGGPRIEDVGHASRQPRGDEVAALVSARAGWATYDAIRLLGTAPRRAAALRLVEEERVGDDGRLVAMPPRTGLVDGWRPDVLLDSVGAHLVRSFDGDMTLADAVDRAATVFDLDPDDVLPAALVAVRGLVEDGLLVLP